MKNQSDQGGVKLEKINYVQCDICKGVVKNSPLKRMLCRNKPDICEDCLQKIKYLSIDVSAELKTLDEVVKNVNWENTNEASTYLQGVQDTLEAMSHHRLNKIKLQNKKVVDVTKESSKV